MKKLTLSPGRGMGYGRVWITRYMGYERVACGVANILGVLSKCPCYSQTPDEGVVKLRWITQNITK